LTGKCHAIVGFLKVALAAENLTTANGTALNVAAGHVKLAFDHSAIVTWTTINAPIRGLRPEADALYHNAIETIDGQPLSGGDSGGPIGEHRYAAEDDGVR
jgi:hypothetical protein